MVVSSHNAVAPTSMLGRHKQAPFPLLAANVAHSFQTDEYGMLKAESDDILLQPC